jgi:hypothetical protein
MNTKTRIVLTAIVVGLFSVAAFWGFAEQGQWVRAVLFGVAFPLGAVDRWRAAARRGDEAMKAATDMIMFVVLALGGISMALSETNFLP